jgi:hypothetical protein
MKFSQAILYAILATTAALAAPFPSPANARPTQRPVGPRPDPSKPFVVPGPNAPSGPHLPAGPHPIQQAHHRRSSNVESDQEPRFSSHRAGAKTRTGQRRPHRHTHAKVEQTPEENGDQEGLETRAFFEVDELD